MADEMTTPGPTERNSVIRWAGLWRSENRLDGFRSHLLFEDCLPKLFRTRNEARAWITEKFGYIRNRPDLKTEPHGWRVPIPVCVKVELEKERPNGD